MRWRLFVRSVIGRYCDGSRWLPKYYWACHEIYDTEEEARREGRNLLISSLAETIVLPDGKWPGTS